MNKREVQKHTLNKLNIRKGECIPYKCMDYIFDRAWKAKGEHDAKICDEYTPQVTINSCSEDKIRANVKQACADAIRNDKE